MENPNYSSPRRWSLYDQQQLRNAVYRLSIVSSLSCNQLLSKKEQRDPRLHLLFPRKFILWK